MAAHLEGLGHEAIVADPNYAPMYGTRSRRIKTDRRDTAALTDACRQGTYRAVHRRSAVQRQRQGDLAVRDQPVRTRTRAVNTARARLRGAGGRLPPGRRIASSSDSRRWRSRTRSGRPCSPSVRSSPTRRRRGRVLRSAQPRVQVLLVQAAWRLLRAPAPAAQPLRQWGLALAARRGRGRAAVAVARRLARLLWAMWRDEASFEARRTVSPWTEQGATVDPGRARNDRPEECALLHARTPSCADERRSSRRARIEG